MSDSTASPKVVEAAPYPDGWERGHAVIHKVQVTARYHRRRQRHFDNLDKWTKVATVLLGASLFGTVLKVELPYVAAAISSLSLLALVYGYSDRKQAHKELAEAALQLAAKFEEVPRTAFSDQMAGQWAAEYERLNAKEPPALKTLVIICEHEQCSAAGYPDQVPRPWWGARLIADFF